MAAPFDSRRGERGSAYVIALLALSVLTLLGLALVLLTRTEVQIGGAERAIQRTFYAADSGLGVAAAQALASGDYTAPTLTMNVTNTVGTTRTGDRVEVTPFVPVLAVRCNWCPANDDGVPKFYKVQHAVTATATRVAWSGLAPDPPADATPLAQKTLSVMVEFQPWPSPPTEPIAEASELMKVRF